MAKFSIIDLFCLIGCLYQIYDITELYLQFKVRHDVAYDYSTPIELPAIDIMVPMVVHMNLTALFDAYPEEIDSICVRLKLTGKRFNYTTDTFSVLFYRPCFAHFQRNPIAYSRELAKFIKVKDIRNSSLRLFDLFISVSFEPFGFLTPRYCTVKEYYSGVAIFARVSCLNGTEPFSVNTNVISLNEGYLHTLYTTFGPYFGIRFSDRNDLLAYDPNKYFTIAQKTGYRTYSTISFAKTAMSSLEYPYETNCRYYNKAESMYKCMTNYSLGQSTPYLIDTLVYEWNEHPDHLGFNSGKGDKRVDGRTIARSDEHYASINCAQDATATECEKTVYSVEGRTWHIAAVKPYHSIEIEHTLKPNIYLSVHPALPWREYVIFIGSILGIWFGISIHDYLSKLLIYVRTRISKTIEKQMQRITNQIKFKMSNDQRSI